MFIIDDNVRLTGVLIKMSVLSDNDNLVLCL